MKFFYHICLSFHHVFSVLDTVRAHIGLPSWLVLTAWLNPLAGVLLPAPLPVAPLARKNPEIPLLPDYAATPPMSFWLAAPCKLLPPTSVSPVDCHALLAGISSPPPA